MRTRTVTVVTEHGTFVRSTDHAYEVIAVLRWPDGVTIGSTWHHSLANARTGTATTACTVLGYYAVATGEQVAPGRAPVAAVGRAAKAAPTPAVVHEYERCTECDRRHAPERVRCGNCWRCHEPSSKCAITRKEIEASIERHAAQPDFYRVLTRAWRPWNEATVPQCACHAPQAAR